MLTIRLESRDSSCVKSNRLTGSRFARDLEKIQQEGYEHWRGYQMLTIRLDSTRIARFVLRKVELTHRKSIC